MKPVSENIVGEGIWVTENIIKVNDEELEIIKEALKCYHNQLFNEKQYKESLEVHDVCQKLKIPGFEIK